MDEIESKDVLLTWFESGMLGTKTPGGAALYEVNVKQRPGGMLAVLKIKSSDGCFVGFVGAGGFRSLVRKIRDYVYDPKAKWRVDEYA